MKLGWNDSMRVVGPDKIQKDGIPVRRVPVGHVWDYKPCVAKLPDGTLLLVDFHQHKETHKGIDEMGKYREHQVLFRSEDHGLTWSRGRHLPLMGREPYLTALDDDTVFITTHFLFNDVFNQKGYTYAIIHRSEDQGKTWTSLEITNETLGIDTYTYSTRNILKRSDGILIMGMTGGEGRDFLMLSGDGGRNWQKRPAVFKGYDTKNYKYSPFQEGVMFYSPSGRLMMMSRMDLRLVNFTRAVPFLPEEQKTLPVEFDQFDSEILFESVDEGITWEPVRGIGFTGMMYPSVVPLGSDKMLLTFTVRVPLHAPMGVQAIVMEEIADGSIRAEMDKDRLVIDEKTPGDLVSGGGFGPTIRLDEETFLTVYSYREPGDGYVNPDGKFSYKRFGEIFDCCPTRVEAALWNMPRFLR